MNEDQPKEKIEKPKNGFIQFLKQLGIILLIGVALIGGTCAIMLSSR
jgi:hypothetical protein